VTARGRFAVAVAWLLQRSPGVLLVPGTSSVMRLRDNVDSVGDQCGR
jgi:pyridoxine 4-dehydrogenase